jgi:hypothetical protein
MRKAKPRDPQQEAIKFALTVAKRWGVQTVVVREDESYRVQLAGVRCPGAALVGYTDTDGAFFTFTS